jgi:hypothetical protein
LFIGTIPSTSLIAVQPFKRPLRPGRERAELREANSSFRTYQLRPNYVPLIGAVFALYAW